MNETRPKLLIVDDIIVNRILLSEIVHQLGYDTVQAGNGKEAINILRSQHVLLVLLDIEMPVMNGVETARYIRDEFPDPHNRIPVIAITAHDPRTVGYDESKSDFDDLVTKPYTFEKISKLVSRYCPSC